MIGWVVGTVARGEVCLLHVRVEGLESNWGRGGSREGIGSRCAAGVLRCCVRCLGVVSVRVLSL